uniref:Anti-silencing function 1Ba histone chaperone n=1 Tax=Cyprinus carpio carpio TaxID=630221 RepID=A0A8C1H709_CYPCA
MHSKESEIEQVFLSGPDYHYSKVEECSRKTDKQLRKEGRPLSCNVRLTAMAKVQVLNVAVLDNPSPFGNPFQFEVTFECMEDLPEDLEWKIIYVGSAESEEYDQTLDSVLVGPVPAGRHMFVFQADAPNTGLIPESDAVGVTVVLITCTYRGQEFIRIGYYVNNEYMDTELRENPPLKPDYGQLQRNILASNPRVTRFHINWEGCAEKMEDSENVDPAPNAMLPPSCTPGKAPPLGLVPDNSMDCL